MHKTFGRAVTESALPTHSPEASALKVYGAGPLSSFGEFGRFESEERLTDFDVEIVADTPYDPTRYQDRLFVVQSFAGMTRDVLTWLDQF
jgi:phenylalanine-4-hydroxylase